MELKCKVQNYHWGKVGAESLVAKFAETAVADFKLEEGKNYAELWMGTHNRGVTKCFFIKFLQRTV